MFAASSLRTLKSRSRPKQARKPSRARPGVEELESRLVPASTVDLSNAIAQQAPLLVAIPKEHLTGLQCHQQFAMVRQAIVPIQWTPTTGDPSSNAADHASFDLVKQQFLNAIDQAETKCGGLMEGSGGGHRGHGHGHPRMHHLAGFTSTEPAFFTTETFETGTFFGPVDDNGKGGCTMQHAIIDSAAMRVVIKRTGGDFFNPVFRVVFATLDLHQRPGLCDDYSGHYDLVRPVIVSHGKVSFDMQGGGQGSGSAGNPSPATIHFNGAVIHGVLSGRWSFDEDNDHGEGDFRLNEVH